MARRPKRLADLVAVVALVLSVLSPMLLGPALGPLVVALGAESGHACACGMAPGTCGCPECTHLEQERLRERAPRPYPVLRGQCGGEGGIGAFAALPPAVPAPSAFALPPPPRVIAGSEPAPARPQSPHREPLTPPPRALA